MQLSRVFCTVGITQDLMVCSPYVFQRMNPALELCSMRGQSSDRLRLQQADRGSIPCLHAFRASISCTKVCLSDGQVWKLCGVLRKSVSGVHLSTLGDVGTEAVILQFQLSRKVQSSGTLPVMVCQHSSKSCSFATSLP